MIEQVIRHFVLYALLRNLAVSGAIMSCHLAWIGLPASRSKVNRIARDLNFVSVYQAKREKLEAHHKEYRVTFSREVQSWSQFHLPWVFSDESMIVKNPFKKKIRVICGLETTERFADYEGYPVKLMVWACIGPNYKSKLIRVTGRLDAAGYYRLLEDNGVIEALDAEYGRMSFVWQQGEAVCREYISDTAKITQFQEASLQFFTYQARLMTSKKKLVTLAEGDQRNAIQLNGLLASESIAIVRGLPQKLQRNLAAVNPS